MMDIMIGEIPLNFRLEVEAENTHVYCGVSLQIFVLLEDDMEFSVKEIGIEPGKTVFLSVISEIRDYTYYMRFQAFFNDSAFDDQQESVVVEYSYRIFDDRGDPIPGGDPLDDANDGSPDPPVGNDSSSIVDEGSFSLNGSDPTAQENRGSGGSSDFNAILDSFLGISLILSIVFFVLFYLYNLYIYKKTIKEDLEARMRDLDQKKDRRGKKGIPRSGTDAHKNEKRTVENPFSRSDPDHRIRE
ncbi:MAG: hypothetical protein ACMUIG_08630 [Thermoplasmatota archaeon]